jgi:thiol:disulfide interchange protein DsbD
MKKHILILTILMLIASASVVYSANFENKTIPGLNITTDVDEAFDASQNENKTLVIIFDQDSCVYCDMLKKDVLSNSDVQKQLNENYVVLLADVNKNPDIASKYDVFGTPAVQFIASNGTNLTKIEGYVDSGEFLKELKEI